MVAGQAADGVSGTNETPETSASWVKALNELPHLIRCSRHVESSPLVLHSSRNTHGRPSVTVRKGVHVCAESQPHMSLHVSGRNLAAFRFITISLGFNPSKHGLD